MTYLPQQSTALQSMVIRVILLQLTLFLNCYCDTSTKNRIDRSPRLTYTQLLPCIFNNSRIPIELKVNSVWLYPDDAIDHYEKLLQITQFYRNLPHHSYKNYKGPWCENHFISTFIKEPLSYFNGLIPIFVQWVDIHVNEIMGFRDKRFPSMTTVLHEIENFLRPNVLYITVSQDDEGLMSLHEKFPNILVLSAGGYGHIPIPLIKGELEYKPAVSPFLYDIGFYGGVLHSHVRMKIFEEVRNLTTAFNLTHKFKQSSHWASDIAATKFNLAPRGFGRTSFRVSEIIQIGRIPVYLYTDTPWVPYEGSKIDLYEIGYVARYGNIRETMQLLANASEADVQLRLQRVRQAREQYTYRGVMEQIRLFFADPLGPRGGDLRCRSVPNTSI